MDILAYVPLVRAMARRYQGPGLEREDLEQEAWLALVEAEREFQPELGVPRAAYYKSRVHAALKQQVRKYRRDGLSRRGDVDVELVAAAVPEFSLAELEAVINCLSLRQRQVLQLHWGCGLALQQVARQLGIGLSAVSTYKRRALANLAKLLSR